MNISSIISRFEVEMDTIRSLGLDTMLNAKRMIDASQDCLQSCKQELLRNPPETVEEEIHFFKYDKQVPLMQLILHAEVRSFELQFPKAGLEIQNRYILKKIKRINAFFNLYIAFCEYVADGLNHLDAFYFTREQSEESSMVSSEFFLQDLDFSTSHDLLLGKVLAYNEFIEYLKRRLVILDHPNLDRSLNPDPITRLNWTSSPTDLVELIYALHHSGSIDNGNSELKNIAETLGRAFNIELGDIYRTYIEIKRRRKDRTKFINSLSASLDSEIEESQS